MRRMWLEARQIPSTDGPPTRNDSAKGHGCRPLGVGSDSIKSSSRTRSSTSSRTHPTSALPPIDVTAAPMRGPAACTLPSWTFSSRSGGARAAHRPPIQGSPQVDEERKRPHANCLGLLKDCECERATGTIRTRSRTPKPDPLSAPGRPAGGCRATSCEHACHQHHAGRR